MISKSFKILIGTMFPIPILFGWLIGSCIQYGCQPKPDQTIELIQSPLDVLDTIIILSSLLATLILYGLVLTQVKSQEKSVEMQSTLLKITQKDSTLRKEILTSEIVMNALNKFNGIDESELIGHLRRTPDVGYDGFDRAVRHLLNICESVAMQYYVLDLDLCIIDNQLGDTIIDLYENTQVKGKKELFQHDNHAYSNIDKFYLTLKKNRDEKNKADSSLN